MLTLDQIETVLISATAHSGSDDRLVVAFRDGQDLYIPLDGTRPANQALLDGRQLYIRTVENQNEYAIYEVSDHQKISTEDRARLEAYTKKPISVDTEVLHVTGTHAAVGQLQSTPPGFVAVVDGSQRALRALAPAIALADWYGRPLHVCAVTAGDDDADTHHAVALQLATTTVDERDVEYVHKPDLDAYLFQLMGQGQIVVASAFGVWSSDGRLHGMLNGLVRHNAPAIIGIGPNVPDDWAPSMSHPLAICIDATEHAHQLVEEVKPLITPPRAPLMVVHVTTETPANTTIAKEVAHEVNEKFGLPVKAKTIAGTSVPEALATFASTVDCQLMVMHSWHRPGSANATVSSTSVTSVAHMPCPVVIVTDA